MNIVRNHMTPPFGGAPDSAGDGSADLQLSTDPGQIDWQALRARLFAAREKMVTGAEVATSRLPLRGSFHGCAASMLTTYQGSLKSVNLDDSSNGKSANGTDTAVAGEDGNGERG